MEKVDPYSTMQPSKVRDSDGNVMVAAYDSNANAKLDQAVTLLGQVLVAVNATVTALNGIRARLDAGINTKTVTALGTVTV